MEPKLPDEVLTPFIFAYKAPDERPIFHHSPHPHLRFFQFHEYHAFSGFWAFAQVLFHWNILDPVTI